MSTLTAEAILLHPDDNVCVARTSLSDGDEVAAGAHRVHAAGAIGMGHKIALEAIEAGQPVRKYGEIIGFATEPIAPGNWVHVHNLSAAAFDRSYDFCTAVPPDPEPITDRTFEGIRRPDGRAGTRNYVAVISSVNCSASVSKYIAAKFDETLLRDYPNIDGVLPLTHKTGCAMQYQGPDHEQLARVLSGFAEHPNIGAYLLVGLGCETASVGHLVDSHELVQLGNLNGNEPKRPPTLTLQETGGTMKTVEAGVRALAELLPQANDVRREPIPVAEIVLGTQCGGSDGSSGITANPAVGVASDLLVAHGATTILGETTEIYGAEHLLTRRARSRDVGEKLLERIRWWEWYAETFGVTINNNPSLGNKAGGLTTIYEKSLGAVAKAGGTALEGVYEYAEPIRQKGFVIMDSPGFDPLSITGMVASGANMVVFTTGRGSCYGCKPVPSIKIATNTPMYERMVDDMDINAGVVLAGSSVAEVGREIFEEILAVASGKKTKSEQHGVGEEEFAPWSFGPLL